MRRLFRAGNNCTGFSLIEVMVALVVLIIGLLGLAGMQSRSLLGNHSALVRSQAVQKAEDILDRMRVNRRAALDGDYDIAVAVIPSEPTHAGLVLADLDEWKKGLSTALPRGDGSVAVAGEIATIVIRWANATPDETITVVTRL